MTMDRFRSTQPGLFAGNGQKYQLSTVQFSLHELAFIQNNFIHLDHDQIWSASGRRCLHLQYRQYRTPTRVSVDLLVQSGLRASTATIPNGVALPSYATMNLSAVQQLRPGTQLRFDVLTLQTPPIKYATEPGVGVGAPQYGIRRTFLAGIKQQF